MNFWTSPTTGTLLASVEGILPETLKAVRSSGWSSTFEKDAEELGRHCCMRIFENCVINVELVKIPGAAV